MNVDQKFKNIFSGRRKWHHKVKKLISPVTAELAKDVGQGATRTKESEMYCETVEDTFLPKPTMKRKLTKKVHSLKAAVDANHSAVRKH